MNKGNDAVILIMYTCTHTHIHTHTHTYIHTDPDWADVNFGVFICIECSGIHRSLGAHIAKVKSIGLDLWSEENVQVQCIFVCVHVCFTSMLYRNDIFPCVLFVVSIWRDVQSYINAEEQHTAHHSISLSLSLPPFPLPLPSFHQHMADGGNLRSKEIIEANVPACWTPPRSNHTM